MIILTVHWDENLLKEIFHQSIDLCDENLFHIRSFSLLLWSAIERRIFLFCIENDPPIISTYSIDPNFFYNRNNFREVWMNPSFVLLLFIQCISVFRKNRWSRKRIILLVPIVDLLLIVSEKFLCWSWMCCSIVHVLFICDDRRFDSVGQSTINVIMSISNTFWRILH